MQLRLPTRILERLQAELSSAGSREIGGVLMGEHVRDDMFEVVAVTVQRSGGTHVGFQRELDSHQEELQAFLARTGNNYTRYNYIGEWHSHPSFPAVPSFLDLDTMQEIVDDPAVGVNFTVLVVARLRRFRRLELSGTLFQARVILAR